MSFAHSYYWDAEGNPLGVDTFLMEYDALGRRVVQSTSTTNTQVLYGLDGNKLALLNGQTLIKALVPLPGGATAVYTASGLAWYRHPDWLGSSRLASTPATRTMYYDGAYSPFGETIAEAGTGTADRSFTGQNQDLRPDLYDFMYRDYHASRGRWISPDPAGMGSVDPSNPQSWNRYAYVNNSPLGSVDPDGQGLEFIFAAPHPIDPIFIVVDVLELLLSDIFWDGILPSWQQPKPPSAPPALSGGPYDIGLTLHAQASAGAKAAPIRPNPKCATPIMQPVWNDQRWREQHCLYKCLGFCASLGSELGAVSNEQSADHPSLCCGPHE